MTYALGFRIYWKQNSNCWPASLPLGVLFNVIEFWVVSLLTNLRRSASLLIKFFCLLKPLLFFIPEFSFLFGFPFDCRSGGGATRRRSKLQLAASIPRSRGTAAWLIVNKSLLLPNCCDWEQIWNTLPYCARLMYLLLAVLANFSTKNHLTPCFSST